jgi:predicted 3-demethylubiquinone-9 3-methyltransferase (glyoxalase superfamily)
MQKITTFLMFEGKAEEAMSLYLSLFEDSRVLGIERYDEGGPGAPGSVKLARFALNGQEFMCIDSSVKHGFTFTPAMSLYVNCASAEELERLFEKLSSDGAVLMPPGSYGFSERFAWVADRYGVSWQLNLA